MFLCCFKVSASKTLLLLPPTERAAAGVTENHLPKSAPRLPALPVKQEKLWQANNTGNQKKREVLQGGLGGRDVSGAWPRAAAGWSQRSLLSPCQGQDLGLPHCCPRGPVLSPRVSPSGHPTAPGPRSSCGETHADCPQKELLLAGNLLRRNLLPLVGSGSCCLSSVRQRGWQEGMGFLRISENGKEK